MGADPAQDVLSRPDPNQVKPIFPTGVGSLEAATYFKSPYYHDSYYFPWNPDPHCRGNNYKTYDEMRDDDQVKVALSFKKDIVVNSGWHVKCDTRPDVAEFVKFSFEQMQESGALQMSFEDAVRDMLTSYDYGFSLTEPVFSIRGGQYVPDSLRVRPPQSFRFLVTDQGDITEIVQMTNRGELHIDPRLMIHHTYQVEWGNPYGKSDLRGVFNSWKAKKFITKYLAIYLERFAGATVAGKYPEHWDSDEVNAFQEALKKIQIASTIAMPDTAMVEFVQANRDSSQMYIHALNYYNMHIARGLLVPDLIGISGEKTSGGSFALGQDQFKLFLATLEKDRRSLARKITLRLVKPLVRANFGDGIDCSFEFVAYTMDDQEKLYGLWGDMVRTGVLTPNADEVSYIRKQLHFPDGPVKLGEPRGAAPLDAKGMPQAVPQQDTARDQGSPNSFRAKAPAKTFGSRPITRQTEFAGLPINVEVEAGEKMSGVGQDGKKWENTYAYPYGEIAGTEGEDADPVDVYLGPNPDSRNVYVVHQNNSDGSFDEDKVFLGFDSASDAEKAYRDHGPAWGFGSMDAMTVDEFKNGYLAANRKFSRKFAKKTTRQPTPAERKVDFSAIQSTLDTAESDLAKRLKRCTREVWQDYLKQIKESGLVERFDPKRLTELKPRFLKDVNVVLKHGFRDLLERAHAEAKKELFPEKKFALDDGELAIDDMMDVLEAEAFNITKDYAGLVNKRVNADVAQGLKQGLSTDDIMALIKGDLPDDTDTWVDTLVRTKTTEIYNRGRKSYFDNDPVAQSVVAAYQYSAILDLRTTDLCRSLDKRVFKADDANINLLTPPLHFNCRSIIVPVTTYEKDSLDDAEPVPDRNELVDMGANLL